MVLIARHLTPELQGYYYTFASLLALQSFVELGFTIVITNVASHEWSLLGLDNTGRIVGDPEALSRLVSLGRLIFKWYAVACLIFIVGVAGVGWLFFSKPTYSGIAWQYPWLALVFLSGLLLWTLPFNGLLEGCNQVVTINRLRLAQAMLESVALWVLLLTNKGLWAAVAPIAAKLCMNLYLLFIQYRQFFLPFFKPPIGSRICWKTEIWPMQWRVATPGLVVYFAYSLFNPVMFHYYGADVAGQMGMTLQMVNGLQLVAMAWVTTKVPRYGMLVAQKEYGALDRLWRQSSLTSLVFIILAAALVWPLIYVLNLLPMFLSQRLLGPLPTGFFLLAAILMQACQCFVVYLRAHKQEPIFLASIVMSLISGMLVWLLGSNFGPPGAAVGYLAQMVIGFIWILVIWVHCRAEWHKS
jgi:O-antigen/teichoic acid export membrane protein